MAITGMTGAVYVSDVTAPLKSFTDEACTGDNENKIFQIDNDTLRYWDPDAEVVIKVDGAKVTTGFFIERIGGRVIFESAITDDVTVSGKALTLIQAGGFFNWSVDATKEEAETTTFGSKGWKEFLGTLKGWSGSADAYWGDEQFISSLGKTVVVKLFTGAGDAQDCFEGFAVITGDGIEVPVDGIVEESVDFTGVGPLYIRMEEEE